MPAENGSSNPVDSFEAFRGMRDAYLDAMSKVMINAVNSDEYAQASGAMLNGALTLSAPFRQALDKSMVMALQQLSLPSRQEVAALAQRFANMEMRLDDMDAKLDRIVNLASSVPPPPAKTDSEAKRPAPAAAKAAHQASTRKR
jgi:cobyrinic acid a,c-diamide synthase